MFRLLAEGAVVASRLMVIAAVLRPIFEEPPRPKTVIAGAPCICTTWDARTAVINRRLDELGGKLESVLKRAAALKEGDAVGGLARDAAECLDWREKLDASLDAVDREKAAHDARFGKEARHAPAAPPMSMPGPVFVPSFPAPKAEARP